MGGEEAWTEAEEGAGRLVGCWRAEQQGPGASEAASRGEATSGPAWSQWSAGNTDPEPKQLHALKSKNPFFSF